MGTPAAVNRIIISIHALCEEGDYRLPPKISIVYAFLSTPSARRATQCATGTGCHQSNFYPRPLRGGRPVNKAEEGVIFYFYPRPLRGGRRTRGIMLDAPSIFLSTPSARRATAKTETKSLFSNKLYNILHEFRRALIYNGSKNNPNHAK